MQEHERDQKSQHSEKITPVTKPISKNDEKSAAQQQKLEGTREFRAIKVELIDDHSDFQTEPCSSSTTAQELTDNPYAIQSSIKSSEASKLFHIPSMVVESYSRFPEATEVTDNESDVKTPFQRFKNQILSAIKLEFPRASIEERHDIAASRWNLLSEEQRRGFRNDVIEEDVDSERAIESANAIRHYQPWSRKNSIQGKANQQPEVTSPLKTGSTDHIREIKKIGACTWCKVFASLNDYSSKIQGREIYCTGLCSQKCFEQAAQKICNVECGYEVFRTAFSEGIQPVTRTSPPFVDPDAPVFRNLPRHKEVPQERIYDREMHRETQENKKSPSKTTPVNNGENTDSLYNIAENTFDWTEYLARTSSSAAPDTCFKQSRISPRNGFKVNMKIECLDPQQDSVFSLATVTTALGPRIRLRFDGCGTSGDIWRLPDSDDIHPVGWCEGNRRILRPPSGFLMHNERYIEYVRKAIQNAELATMNLFKREPATPRENNFKIGMKLEAVHKNNPALIGVATVAEVDSNRIRIEFDGYTGSGYWTFYSDRDLFNVGWCYTNGYPLQPPGDSSLQNLALVSHSEKMISTSGAKERKLYTPSSCCGEVDVHINVECDPGPYMNSEKVALIPSVFQGGIAVVLKSVLEELIRCAYEPKTVFGFLKPGRGNVVVNAECDGMVYKCYLSNVDRVSAFWKTMEQFCDNLRSCSNFISGFELQTTCPQCGRGSGARKGPTCGQKRANATSQSAENILSCRSNTPDSTAANSTVEDNIMMRREFSKEIHKRQRLEYVEAGLKTSPRTWSVDDVVKFIEKTDLKDFVSIFHENDIDGKALLLLNQDIIIKYMGLKIGPAVKLLVVINELKEVASQWK